MTFFLVNGHDPQNMSTDIGTFHISSFHKRKSSCLYYFVAFLHSHLPQQPKVKEKKLNSGIWIFKRGERFERLIVLVKRKMEVKFTVTPSAFVSKTLTAALTSLCY